jgi:lysozyme
MRTSPAGIALIKDCEGCKLTAYLDAVGVPTIAWGHTGVGVKLGMTCTLEEAFAMLMDDIQSAEHDVAMCVKVALTQGQFDALVSFVFNLGAYNLQHSKLLRLLNAGDYAGAAGEFSRWVYAGSNKLPGLVTRRQREKSMFLDGTLLQ